MIDSLSEVGLGPLRIAGIPAKGVLPLSDGQGRLPGGGDLLTVSSQKVGLCYSQEQGALSPVVTGWGWGGFLCSALMPAAV